VVDIEDENVLQKKLNFSYQLFLRDANADKELRLGCKQRCKREHFFDQFLNPHIGVIMTGFRHHFLHV
jgi:hypothetical protein